MKSIAIAAPPVPARRLQRLGDAMQRNAGVIRAVQWLVVVSYLFMVIVPAFLPLPPESAGILDNLTRFAQFLFWGIWWPFVMLSMMIFGRLWCGVFCPEGALSEWASRRSWSLGRPVPRWLKWGGWPFVAFAITTTYGQLVSVYEYPKAVLLVLGGSTVAAIGIGLIFGRGKRVWCRHLCPASGVFALLAKVAPVHFQVDRATWDRTPGQAPLDCAPLIDVRRMSGASECHACGRCSGYRQAVRLAARSPAWEILATPAENVKTAEALTLIFGVLGIATAAFQWTVSPWFLLLKTSTAEWLVNHDYFLLLKDNAPWWLLTHYPEANDVFTWLDGLCVLAYIVGVGALLGGSIWAALALAARCLDDEQLPWRRLTMALVPLGGISVFLGLTMLTVTLLKAEGIVLPWLPGIRMALLAFGLAASGWLGLRLVAASGSAWQRRLAAAACLTLPLIAMGGNWYQTIFIW